MSLIGFQKISHKEAIDLIIQELNNPTIPMIKDWPNNQQRKWNFVINNSKNEYLAFIYDESTGIELNKAISIESAFVALIRVNKTFDFMFVNMHVNFKEFDHKFIQTIDQNYGKIDNDMLILIEAVFFLRTKVSDYFRKF